MRLPGDGESKNSILSISYNSVLKIFSVIHGVEFPKAIDRDKKQFQDNLTEMLYFALI